MTAEGRTYRVLLVEDDPGVRELVETHLRRQRFEVKAEGSAEAVLHALRDGGLAYDLALVDVHLPGRSGVELSRLLLTTSPLSPVLIITGDDDERVAREALGDGATGYLLKPFELFELDAAVAQAVSMRDLVETTETLARAQSTGIEDWGESGGALPRSWLHVGDERSGAGAGHGSRVVSIAGLLAKTLGPEQVDGPARERLRMAGRTHEIGRITGGGNRLQVAKRSAQLLDDLGFDAGVCETVRQAAEDWSPGIPLTARMLSLADLLDHDAVRRSAMGDEPGVAIRGAVDAVGRGAGDDFDPDLALMVLEDRDRIESMWVLQRQAAPG